jgi:hypothetical protein
VHHLLAALFVIDSPGNREEALDYITINIEGLIPNDYYDYWTVLDIKPGPGISDGRWGLCASPAPIGCQFGKGLLRRILGSQRRAMRQAYLQIQQIVADHSFTSFWSDRPHMGDRWLFKYNNQVLAGERPLLFADEYGTIEHFRDLRSYLQSIEDRLVNEEGELWIAAIDAHS